MNLPITITICCFILGITFTLVKIIYDIIIRRVESLEDAKQTHALDIQSLKDHNTFKIDRIEKDIENLIKKIDNKMHADSDLINQQKDIISRLHRFLDLKELV